MSRLEGLIKGVKMHYPDYIQRLIDREHEEIIQEFFYLLFLEQRKKKQRKKLISIMQRAIRNVLKSYYHIKFSNGKTKILEYNFEIDKLV